MNTITTTDSSLELRGTRLKDLEAAGLSLEREADGTCRACAERLQLRHLRLPTAAGTIGVSRVTLAGALVRLSALRADGSFGLLGLSADEIQLESVDLELVRRPRFDESRLGRWRLDALAALQGLLRIFIRDAAWVVDADISMPIADGAIDFDRVVVEHFGPNSAMGVGRDGVYVDAPNGARTPLFRFSAPEFAGVEHETRSGFGVRVSDRGRLDLRAFAEAWLAAGTDQPLGQPASREVERMLDRTKLSGELRLGDGVLGSQRQHLLLSGHAEGKNRLSVSAAVLGHRLVLRLPALCASGAVFELLGQRGSAGPVSATLEAHATGLSGPAGQPAARTDAGVSVSVHHLTLRQVVLGEVAKGL